MGSRYKGYHSNSDSDVDMAVDVAADDDGPRPMINFKRTQKRMNGTDQFNKEHEGRHELYAQRSRDPVEAVRQHNRDYPRLDKELARRASITKITTIKGYELNKSFDQNCMGCVQLATFQKLKKLRPKPKCKGRRPLRQPSRPKARSRRRVVLSSARVAKKDYGHFHGSSRDLLRRRLNLSTLWKHKSCQVSGIKINKCTSPDLMTPFRSDSKLDKRINKPSSLIHHNSLSMVKEDPARTQASNGKDEDAGSGGCRRMKSEHPSLSSINSFGSLEHEPMVE